MGDTLVCDRWSQGVSHGLLVYTQGGANRTQSHPKSSQRTRLPRNPLESKRLVREHRKLQLDLPHGSNWSQSCPPMLEPRSAGSAPSAGNYSICALAEAGAARRLANAINSNLASAMSERLSNLMRNPPRTTQPPSQPELPAVHLRDEAAGVPRGDHLANALLHCDTACPALGRGPATRGSVPNLSAQSQCARERLRVTRRRLVSTTTSS
jgi:hypothetical protein